MGKKSTERLVEQKINAHLQEQKEEKNAAEEEILPGQIYYHYKSPKHLYEIIGIARHSDTLAEMVVYKALYAEDYPLGQVWVRPKKDFLGKTIDKKTGKEVDRFSLVK